MMTLKWRRFSSVGAAVIPGTGAAQTHGQQRPCVRGQTPRVCAARAQLAPSLPRGGFMRGPQGANVAGRGGIEARGGGSTAARAAAVATHRDLSAGSPSPVSHPPRSHATHSTHGLSPRGANWGAGRALKAPSASAARALPSPGKRRAGEKAGGRKVHAWLCQRQRSP